MRLVCFLIVIVNVAIATSAGAWWPGAGASGSPGRRRYAVNTSAAPPSRWPLLRLHDTRGKGHVVDEGLWQRTEPPIGVGGQVSLRGLPPLVVVQVLLGLQQRCRLDGVRTKEADLRSVCDDLRRQQVASIADYQLQATRSLAFAGLVNALARHVRRALTSPVVEATREARERANDRKRCHPDVDRDWVIRSAAALSSNGQIWGPSTSMVFRVRSSACSTVEVSVYHALYEFVEPHRWLPSEFHAGSAGVAALLHRICRTGQVVVEPHQRFPRG